MGHTTELAGRFLHNTSRLEAAAETFADDQWRTEPGEGLLSAHVIVGRIAAKRRRVLRRLGHDLALEPWEGSFMNGPFDGLEDNPDPADLLRDFTENGVLLAAHVDELTDEDAEREWGAPQPDGSTSTLGALGYHAMDESSDLGQLELMGQLLVGVSRS